jgi:hypothetical protein
MTGAFLRVKRGDKYLPVEVEFLTDEELDAAFLDRTPEALVSWIKMLCGHLRHLAPLMQQLERDGIVQPVSKEEYEKAQGEQT